MIKLQRTWRTLAVLAGICLVSGCASPSGGHNSPDPIRVVVWDERQPAQRRAYGGGFLGDAIAEHLRTRPGIVVTSVGQDEYGDLARIQRLVADCDVLIWWGHMRHDEIAPQVGRMIVQRIKEGRLNLIALHSAHWATPFVEAMHERARMDAQQQFAAADQQVDFEFISPPPKMDVFRAGLEKLRTTRLTPYAEPRKYPDGRVHLAVHLPLCVFPAYREDGKPSRVLTLAPGHPIASDIPPQFSIARTEMYDEPFHVPEPDVVIFEERWETGEWFRSGCVWRLGRGQVFYFRPGHETYPIFKEPLPLKIIENAARWMGTR